MLSLLKSGGRADIYAFIAPEFETVPIVLEASVLAILGRTGVELGLEIVPLPKGGKRPSRPASHAVSSPARRAKR